MIPAIASVLTEDLTLLPAAPFKAYLNFGLAGFIHFFVGWTFLSLSQKLVGASRTSALIGATPLFGFIEGTLDTRGRKGLANVPVHYKAVRLTIRIKTEESDNGLNQLTDLVARYAPVDSLIKAVVPDYEVSWERMA